MPAHSDATMQQYNQPMVARQSTMNQAQPVMMVPQQSPMMIQQQPAQQPQMQAIAMMPQAPVEQLD